MEDFKKQGKELLESFWVIDKLYNDDGSKDYSKAFKCIYVSLYFLGDRLYDISKECPEFDKNMNWVYYRDNILGMFGILESPLDK